MQDALERLNLNVPRTVRAQLRALATQAGRTEGEMARALLIRALEGARREEFFRRVIESHTPAVRARDLEILNAFERLDG